MDSLRQKSPPNFARRDPPASRRRRAGGQEQSDRLGRRRSDPSGRGKLRGSVLDNDRGTPKRKARY